MCETATYSNFTIIVMVDAVIFVGAIVVVAVVVVFVVFAFTVVRPPQIRSDRKFNAPGLICINSVKYCRL